MGWFKEVEYQENALVSVLFHASSTDFEAKTEKNVFIFIWFDKWQLSRLLGMCGLSAWNSAIIREAVIYVLAEFVR